MSDYPPSYPPTVKTSHKMVSVQPDPLAHLEPPVTGGEVVLVAALFLAAVSLGIRARNE